MNAVREALSTVDAYATLDKPFLLSFPELVLPPRGMRPISHSEIEPVRLHREAGVRARRVECDEVPAPPPPRTGRGRFAAVVALLVLPTLGAVGGCVASGSVNVDDVTANLARFASSVTTSMAKGIEGVSAAGVFE
jgi:hypothetical protein